MKIKTEKELDEMFNDLITDKKWVAVDDIKKRINDVGIITISRPSRLDSETMIEVTEKLSKIIEELTKDQNDAIHTNNGL